MLADFSVPIPWKRILGRLVVRVFWGDSTQIAAQLAYYFTLALAPGLICFVAFVRLFPLPNLTDPAVHLLSPLVPGGVLEIVKAQLTRLSEGHVAGVLAVGLFAAIWTGSAAIGALMSAANRAYGIEDQRPWWRNRLVAMALTFALLVFLLTSITLLLIGPEGVTLIAARLGFDPGLSWLWQVTQWCLIAFIIAMTIRVVYFFAPDADQTWVWFTPGSVLAVALWLAGSLAFRFYVMHFGRYDLVYGTIGASVILLLWCYVTGFALAVGIELDAVINRASPWSASSIPRAIGERPCIGAKAARCYDANRDASARAE
jgi:membrane protein